MTMATIVMHSAVTVHGSTMSHRRCLVKNSVNKIVLVRAYCEMPSYVTLLAKPRIHVFFRIRKLSTEKHSQLVVALQ